MNLSTKYTFLFLLSICSIFNLAAQQLSNKNFEPGKVWLDTSGKPINAHSGGILFHKGIYYWYGEHKIVGKSEATAPDGGIHCYSSKDLLNWQDEGIVMSVDYNNPDSDIAYKCILQRPKVIFDKKTKTFIAYFKLYDKIKGYAICNTGIASSKKPTGPFNYLGKSLAANSPDGSGDFAMFTDQKGTLFHMIVRKPNKQFVIGNISETPIKISEKYSEAVGITHHTEAPAVFFYKNQYYLLGSASSGWTPNSARLFKSDSITGTWTNLGNPTRGINPINNLGPEKTFGGQSTFVIPVQGKKNAFIAMFDVWKPENPIESPYIWLPITFENDMPVIEWRNEWNLSVFDK